MIDEGPWPLFMCHACGWRMAAEQPDLACERCGEPRRMIEEIEVVPLFQLEDAQQERERMKQAYQTLALSLPDDYANTHQARRRAEQEAQALRLERDRLILLLRHAYANWHPEEIPIDVRSVVFLGTKGD